MKNAQKKLYNDFKAETENFTSKQQLFEDIMYCLKLREKGVNTLDNTKRPQDIFTTMKSGLLQAHLATMRSNLKAYEASNDPAHLDTVIDNLHYLGAHDEAQIVTRKFEENLSPPLEKNIQAELKEVIKLYSDNHAKSSGKTAMSLLGGQLYKDFEKTAEDVRKYSDGLTKTRVTLTKLPKNLQRINFRV